MAEKQILNEEELEKVAGGAQVTVYIGGRVEVNGHEYTPNTPLSQLLEDFPNLANNQSLVMFAATGMTIGQLLTMLGFAIENFASTFVKYLKQNDQNVVVNENEEEIPLAGL